MNPELPSKPNVDSSLLDLSDCRLPTGEPDFVNVNVHEPGKIAAELMRRIMKMEEAAVAPAETGGPSCADQSIYMIVELALSAKQPPYKFASGDEIVAAHGVIDQLIERYPGLRRVTNTRLDMPFVLRLEASALGAVSELVQLAEVERLS